MNLKRFIIAMAAAAVLLTSCGPKDGVYVKPRVIVTCDPELDDNNSMIRYILHSTDFQTEGLIYTSADSIGEGTERVPPSSSPEQSTTSSDSALRLHGDICGTSVS